MAPEIAVQVAPAVSGTPADGATLTADPGTWNGSQPIAFAYQWRRCDADGANCTTIAGATNPTYTAGADDVHRTLRVTVTATNAGGSGSASSAVTGAVAANPPVDQVAPTVDGTARDRATLTAAPGTWGGTAPIAFAYQWQRCDAAGAGCADIADATSRTYAETATDVGRTVRVVVTATNDGGTAEAHSAPTAAVAPVAPENTAAPTVSGTARDGGTLAAARGTWTGTPDIAYTNQWVRCDANGAGCAPISGATGATYTPTAADVGHALRVVVTATNSAGTRSQTSDATAATGRRTRSAGCHPRCPGRRRARRRRGPRRRRSALCGRSAPRRRPRRSRRRSANGCRRSSSR